MDNKNLPLRKTMCETCPFRRGSPYAYLKQELTLSALSVSRICHSTGSGNAINHRTGIPRHLCRGARNVSLTHLKAMGIIEAASDKAWDKKRVECGLLPTLIQDPEKKP